MPKYSTWALFLIPFAISSCSSHMAVLQQDKYESSVAFNEMRAEIADLKHDLNSARVEIQILEEQVQNQETLSKKTKNTPAPFSDNKLSLLEKRLALIEQMQGKIQTDLKQLSSHANQTTSCLQQYSSKILEVEQKIRDVGDLKSSLKAFTTSISTENLSKSSYKVKAGDSLEKIAKNHKVSIDSLKKANQLSQDKIFIGQELVIP